MCRRRRDPGPGEPCGRRRCGEPFRRHRTEFFPPPFEPEDAGLGVAEDPSDGGGGTEAGKPIGIVEATVFSHAEILPEISRGENTKTSRTINKL